MPSRRTWTHAPSRKTNNVNALLVPSKRMWTINLPRFKNPITIVHKLQDIFKDKILFGMKFWQIKHTDNKLAIGWRRSHDFKHMCLAERWVPCKTMCAFTSLSGTQRYEVKEKKYSYILFKIQPHHSVITLFKHWQKVEYWLFCPTF